MSQKGLSLVLGRLKVREVRDAFRFARFCYCNFTIKITIVLIILLSCLKYFKGLIEEQLLKK